MKRWILNTREQENQKTVEIEPKPEPETGWVQELKERNYKYREAIERGEPDCWFHPETYEIAWTYQPNYLPLCPGDSLRYGFSKNFKFLSSIIHHPMLYVGKGFVMGFVTYEFGKGKINLEFLPRCFPHLINNGKKGIEGTEGNEGKEEKEEKEEKGKKEKKPTLETYSLKNCSVSRIQRLERAFESYSFIFPYHIVYFNCQTLHQWWLGCAETPINTFRKNCFYSIIVFILFLFCFLFWL